MNTLSPIDDSDWSQLLNDSDSLFIPSMSLSNLEIYNLIVRPRARIQFQKRCREIDRWKSLTDFQRSGSGCRSRGCRSNRVISTPLRHTIVCNLSIVFWKLNCKILTAEFNTTVSQIRDLKRKLAGPCRSLRESQPTSCDSSQLELCASETIRSCAINTYRRLYAWKPVGVQDVISAMTLIYKSRHKHLTRVEYTYNSRKKINISQWTTRALAEITRISSHIIGMRSLALSRFHATIPLNEWNLADLVAILNMSAYTSCTVVDPSDRPVFRSDDNITLYKSICVLDKLAGTAHTELLSYKQDINRSLDIAIKACSESILSVQSIDNKLVVRIPHVIAEVAPKLILSRDNLLSFGSGVVKYFNINDILHPNDYATIRDDSHVFRVAAYTRDHINLIIRSALPLIVTLSQSQ